MKMKTIHMIKTYYPQWGEYTAFNSFLKYFNKQQFKIKISNIPMGDENFPLRFLKKYCQQKIKKKRVQEYKLNDLVAEISIFIKTFSRKVDLVHFIDAEHSLMFFPYWNKRYRFLRSLPKIVAMFHQPPSILESLVNIDIVKRVDHVLVISPTQAEYFEQYLPPERIDTILLGVDTDHFKPTSPGKRNSKKFKCLAGGIWLRDYDAVFKTAALLQTSPGIEFHIVAPKKENPGDMKNVVFHENIPDRALLDLYQNCDVLFLPMQDATANTFLLEGSACGLPVISSDLPAVKTYFPGEEAVLIKDNDPGAFAETIIDLYNNPQKLSRLSACARKRALELSWDIISREYERLYMDL